MAKLERILVATAGSRGDIQPFVAVALALKKAGYTVMVASNADFDGFVRSFGLDFHGAFPAAKFILQDNEVVREAMLSGNLWKFIDAMAVENQRRAKPTLEGWKAVLDLFKPDLVVGASILTYYMLLAQRRLQIPTLEVALHAYTLYADSKRLPFGMPSLPFGLNTWFWHNFVMVGAIKNWAISEPFCQEVYGFTVLSKALTTDELDRVEKPRMPYLVAQGPVFQEVFYDHVPKKENVHFLGSLLLDNEVQVAQAKASQEGTDGDFGSSKTIQAIKDFIGKGAAPVYMGWGSMVVKSTEFMTRLVVEAAKISGKRAIVQAGWAELKTESLDPRKDADLITYAKEHILFVQDVPHEWLFPQCACTVHHGGLGTLTAALRAGVPTIVTPTMMDQYDHAYMVTKLGVGVGTKQFHKANAKELGQAILTCTSDAAMAARAREVKELICKEDGTARLVEEVKAFWEGWVQTGRLAEVWRRNDAEDRAAAAKAQSPSCFCC